MPPPGWSGLRSRLVAPIERKPAGNPRRGAEAPSELDLDPDLRPRVALGMRRPGLVALIDVHPPAHADGVVDRDAHAGVGLGDGALSRARDAVGLRVALDP